MSDAEILERANNAKSLLNNQEFQRAFDGVRQALLERFEECPIRDKEAQHEIKLMLKLLVDVKANLQSVVDSGKVVIHRQSLVEKGRKVINAFRN
jgi:hypothetical protein